MTPTAVEIQERVDLRLLSNLSSNFSNSREAIFELVDNGLAGRRGDEPVRVTITGSGWSSPGGTMKVVTMGGSGMGLEGLTEFLHWGKQPHGTTLNRYGQGGKAAIGYLGRAVRVRANESGSDTAYEIEDSDWLARPDGKEKRFVAKPCDAVCPEQGVVEIEILRLTKRINARKLERELAWRYRPALLSGGLDLRVKSRQVKPVELEGDPRQDFDYRLILSTPEEPDGTTVRLRGWVGIAPPRFDGRGGMRCSTHGRVVVENEYFGHRSSSYKASLNSLVGEVDLSFVPPLLNKNEFDRDTPAWEAAAEAVHREMTPFIEKLLQRRETSEPSEEERMRAMEAKDLAKRALEKIAAESSRRGASGVRRGRKSPTPSGESSTPPPASRDKSGRQPRTPPPEGAVGQLSRKGVDLDWDVRALDPKIRSATSTENGRTEIVINTEFPMYRLRKGDFAYMVETGLAEQLKSDGEDDKSAGEYSDVVAEAVYEAITMIEKR
jgi:hypothetical protein